MKQDIIREIVEDFNNKHLSINADDLILLVMGYGAQEVSEQNWSVETQYEVTTCIANILSLVLEDKATCKERIAQARRAYERACEAEDNIKKRRAAKKNYLGGSERIHKAFHRLLDVIAEENPDIAVSIVDESKRKQ